MSRLSGWVTFGAETAPGDRWSTIGDEGEGGPALHLEGGRGWWVSPKTGWWKGRF